MAYEYESNEKQQARSKRLNLNKNAKARPGGARGALGHEEAVRFVACGLDYAAAFFEVGPESKVLKVDRFNFFIFQERTVRRGQKEGRARGARTNDGLNDTAHFEE